MRDILLYAAALACLSAIAIGVIFAICAIVSYTLVADFLYRLKNKNRE